MGITHGINTDNDKCSGCSLCMLACSWRQIKGYAPDKAFIQISNDKKRNRIQIRIDFEKCDLCLSCVKECPTGALTPLKGEH